MDILLKEICNLLDEENTVISLEIKHELQSSLKEVNAIIPERKIDLNLTEKIRDLLESSQHKLAKEIINYQKVLVWRKTTFIPSSKIPKEISNLFYVCPIMGLDCFIPSKKFRLGFLYQIPFSYYPLHNHNAVESYAVIAGDLNWSDGKNERVLSAGDIIHHPKLLPHAFKTHSLGFLGLWHWSGDVSPESYQVLE